MVKGKTNSGIKFQVDERIKDDARFLRLLTKVQKNGGEDTEKSGALFDLLALVFGSEEGLAAFMDAVADAHEGICSITQMIEEIREIFGAMNAKNS